MRLYLDRAIMSSGLIKAVEHFKTRRALAKAVGVRPMTVTQWFNRGLPAHRAKQICDATGGVLTIQDLLPELFQENQKDKAF